MTFLKKKHSAAEIHAAFDAAEDEILTKCKNLIEQPSVEKEPDIIRKAKLLKELGFANSETIAKAQPLLVKARETQEETAKAKKISAEIMELKVTFPNNKFITVDEFNKICKKYNLDWNYIHHYKMDVPEKNLLEIKNTKPLPLHLVRPKAAMFNFALNHGNLSFKAITWLSKLQIPYDTKIASYTLEDMIQPIIDQKWGSTEVARLTRYIHSICPYKMETNFAKSNIYPGVSVLNYSGFMIAAPKSHFAKGKSVFSKLTLSKPAPDEDPVVFDFLSNGLIRVVTKWGTPDDQSYLDPLLTNEQFN